MRDSGKGNDQNNRTGCIGWKPQVEMYRSLGQWRTPHPGVYMSTWEVHQMQLVTMETKHTAAKGWVVKAQSWSVNYVGKIDHHCPGWELLPDLRAPLRCCVSTGGEPISTTGSQWGVRESRVPEDSDAVLQCGHGV